MPVSPLTRALLEVRDLTGPYDGRGETRTAVENLSFEIGAGEVLGIEGLSGCDKTTIPVALLKLLPGARKRIGFLSQQQPPRTERLRATPHSRTRDFHHFSRTDAIQSRGSASKSQRCCAPHATSLREYFALAEALHKADAWLESGQSYA